VQAEVEHFRRRGTQTGCSGASDDDCV
jgi:hypothetical protein